MADYTWRTHDRLLVLRQLRMWSTERGAASIAAQAFADAVRELADQGDTSTLFDLVWCYILVTKDGDPLPIESGSLRDVVEHALQTHRSGIGPEAAAQAEAILRAL